MASTQINTGLVSDVQMKEFLELLVQFLTGKNLEDYDAVEQPQIAQKVVEAYQSFLMDWLQKNKGTRTAMQFKIFKTQQDPALLDRFGEDINDAVSEAHLAFLEQMDPTKQTQTATV